MALLNLKKGAADALLDKSQKRFESLVENGLDCVIIISPEGRSKYVSRSVKNILGYTPEEVLNIDITTLVHPDDVIGAQDALMKTLQNPGLPIQGYTSRVKHKNGSWRWIEPVVTNLLHDPAIQGIVDNFRDVTDRINTEEKLKLTSERFLLATKGSNLGIWDMDLANNVLIWDEAMYIIYAITDTSFQLSYGAWLNIIHEDDRNLLHQKVTKLLEDGLSIDLEYRIVRPNNTIRYIRAIAQIYHDDAGKANRIVGTNLDITNHKHYEQTLEQILFDISHIIRQPVTNILGLSNLLEASILKPKELDQLVAYMKESAQNLDDFTTTITNTYLEKKLIMKGLSEKVNDAAALEEH